MPTSPQSPYDLGLKIHHANPNETILTFDDNALASVLYGQFDQNLSKIEKALGIHAVASGNRVRLSGAAEPLLVAEGVLRDLWRDVKKGRVLNEGDVDGALRLARDQGTLFVENNTEAPDLKAEIKTRRRSLLPRTAAQAKYIDMLHKMTLVFASGPAGTGKTYLAVAYAAMLLEKGAVDRVVLSRPAVEAGERLGFLPGDMKEKVDPYLRPLYDALYDMLPPDKIERGMQTGQIEVAPLAFMRGRTLSNAAIILDEAQNATKIQMKMFLTRLGENARMIITGDPSQVDLPQGQVSGLQDAIDRLQAIPSIGLIKFTNKDVVRHPLVAEILNAYDNG